MASEQAISKVQQDRLDILARASLKMAGFKPAYLKRALQRYVEALDASSVRIYSNRQTGEIIERVEVPDHQSRIMAAREICRMIPGMYPSEALQAQGSSGVVVEVRLLSPDGTEVAVKVGAAHTTSSGTSGQDDAS